MTADENLPEPCLLVCLKWVPLRPEIDPLTGSVDVDQRFSGLSPADRAALEWALRVGRQRDLPVVATSVGSGTAEAGLREALAHGATAGLRIDHGKPEDLSSRTVALLLAEVGRTASLIFCGNHSLDRGSGAVPAFLAHELGFGQALGCVRLELPATTPEDATDRPGSLVAERRLDQGRRERLAIEGPTVLSFEGGLELGRAPLSSALDSAEAAITVVDSATATASTPEPGPAVLATGPYRPRPRALAAPRGSTLDRIHQLTGFGDDRPAAQQVELEPGQAADAVLERLRQWGYLDS